MKKKLLATALYVLPAMAMAQELEDVKTLARSIGDVLAILIPVVFTLALLYFFWGLAKYILNAGEEKEKGKDIMIWGIVALFVMSAIWGIVGFIGGALGIDENQNAPTINIPVIDR